MILDVHAHYHPRAYMDALSSFVDEGRRNNFIRFPASDDEEHIQGRLEMMEKANVGLQVLSPAAGLAPYTQDAYIGAGESMDIDRATPAESRIKAFLFDTYATFTLFGQENELRLCIGITKPELEFKMQHGAEKLLALLKRHGVYPFTDLERNSLPLDDKT